MFSINLLGIFLFSTLINYSVQLKCYDCRASIALAVPDSLKQKSLDLPSNVCPDPLTDQVLKDCRGKCRKVDYTFQNTRMIYRSCEENIDCAWFGNVAQALNGTVNSCPTCDKDKCNSAESALISTSLLAICFSFLTFRIIFS